MASTKCKQMFYHTAISKRLFHFKQSARTSRGEYLTRESFFVTVTADDNEEVKGGGECATLPDLSCDAVPEYENILRHACRQVEETGQIDREVLRPYPHILFGLAPAM